MKKPKTKSAAKAAPELPVWLRETPIDAEYDLVMHESGPDGQECQAIEMTRNEFLILKIYLAKLRGLIVPTETPEGFELGKDAVISLWNELEPQEIAAVPEAAHA